MAEEQDPKRQDRPDNNRNGGPNRQQPPPNLISRTVLTWILLVGSAVMILLFLNNQHNQPREVSPQTFVNHARLKHFEGEVVRVEDDRMVGELKKNTPGLEQNAKPPYEVQARISKESKDRYIGELWPHVEIKERPGDSILWPLLFSYGPIILVLFIIYFFVFRSLRNAGGGPGMLGSFGRSRHKVMNKEHSNVTLADVAGIDEAKDEIGEIIEFLKNPKKFQRLGGRVPRGVLLIGEPGCGKTLLAKAVAGEADVPFFSISGSDFVEMFVGVGASRVRDLFKQAKDSSPCIIFLDEIDAVGRRRGSGFSSGGHDEREQTLNAILVEMDGFDTNDQVIVIAATNRADVLDPALTRPGRFDRQIHVPLPDLRGRMEILKVHSRRIKMSPDANLEKLARGTPMFSGADLAAIINEAAISATLQTKDFVEQDDLEEARDKVKWGRARKSHRIEEDEKKVIAYHEAGHALVMYFDPGAEPLHKVTIIPRGQALGVTFMLPERDRHIYTRKQLLAQLRVTFGGRIAEDLFCGDISSGAAQDIRQATAIARAMVTEYGMSERLGFQLLGIDESKNPWEQPDKLYSDETARLIDEEVRGIIERTYGETRALLTEHRQQLIDLAEALLRFETLNREEVDRVMRGEKLGRTTVSDLLKAEHDKAKDGVTIRPESTGLGNDTGGAVPTPA
jgi:cell division protease FtsH